MTRAPMIAVALTALAGQVASLGHMLLVRHAICLEHGELIHSDQVDAPATSMPRGAGPSASPADAPALENRGHVHCALVARRRDVHVPRLLTAVALPPMLGLAAPPCTVALLPIQTIAVAPKGSPPV